MRELHPLIQPRIWGGTLLKEWFSKGPEDQPVGEAWLLSDHPAGKTLDGQGQPISESTEASSWFPILIKVLHAKTDLSVQVHPDDSLAKISGDRGKTEGWLILSAEPGAKICYGHNFSDQEAMKSAIANGTLVSGLQYIEVTAGEYYSIPPGTVHALGAGTIVLETQQASDTTYRLYDYGRLENGSPRKLHIEDGVNATSFPQKLQGAQRGEASTLEELFYLPVKECQLYDDNPFYQFATAEIEEDWSNQVRQGHHLAIVAMSGSVRPEGSDEVDQAFRTWLFEPGESVTLTGSGRVALIGIPQQAN